MENKCTVCGNVVAPGETACANCGRAYYALTCNACGQPAPTLIRGARVICSGCGATRGPLSGVPLGMAGSAHRVGSVITSIFAWVTMLATVLFATVTGLAVGFFSHNSTTGALTGLGFGMVGLVMSWLMLSGSKKLKDRGDSLRDDALQQSVLAMAMARKGAVTTIEVAQNLSLTLREADRVLSEMTYKGHAMVEVNPDGVLQYTFRDIRLALRAQQNALQAQGATGVRVATEAPRTRVGTAIDETRPAADVARERVDEEYEAMAERHRTGRF